MNLFSSILSSRFLFSPRYMFNRFRQNMEYLQRKTFCHSYPAFLTLELSSVCNLDCVMCPRRRMKREKGNMEFSLFKKIIDQIHPFTETVDLDLYGEFSFNPRWREMVEYAKYRNLFTLLNTNATLLNERVITDLIESGLDFLNISFDGANRETYEKIRRGAKYDDTLENINAYLSVNKNIFTVIQMIHTTETENEIEEYTEKWAKSPVSAVRIKEYIPFDPETGYLNPSVERNQPGDSIHCLSLWKTMAVCQDGMVVPCCVDYDQKCILGDANRESILDIWNSRTMTTLREKHVRGEWRKVPLCAHCHPYGLSATMLIFGSLPDDPARRKLIPLMESLSRKTGKPIFRR